MNKSTLKLNPGETGVIVSIGESQLSPKLLEMGFLPGRRVKLVRKAPGGCPLYLDVQGHFMALRTEEADSILLDDSTS